MKYEFEDAKTGEVVEIEMSMHDAIPIGNTYKHKGRKLVRVASLQSHVAVQRDPDCFTAVSQQPIFDKGEQEKSGHPHWNNDPTHYGYGCPVFPNRSSIKNYLKENGGVYDSDGMNEVKP